MLLLVNSQIDVSLYLQNEKYPKSRLYHSLNNFHTKKISSFFSVANLFVQISVAAV